MTEVIQALKASGFKGEIRLDEPMSAHTTFCIGGPADIMAIASCEMDVEIALALCRARHIPLFIMGNGSNLLVRDGGIPGITLVIGPGMQAIAVEGPHITAQAGIPLSRLSGVALDHGLEGLAFASGIPGTLGGGLAMNAGAYGGQLSDVVIRARALTQAGSLMEFEKSDMALGYRTSRFIEQGLTLLGATLTLTPGDPGDIRKKMTSLNARRREKQPLNQPSAGSVFKRPSGHFAGALVEGAGLKGFKIGGAMVSPLHAGFIVNAGGATARDVEALIGHIQNEVFKMTGIKLETEIRIIVTGLSGAGKSHALRTLEDMGFFCVDNLPPALLPSITSLCLKADDIDRLAVGIDVRSGAFFGGIEGALDELGQTGVEYEILYLQVGNEEVVRRYKETRRSHPMGGDPMLIQSIEKERTRLIPMQARATRIIDTTNMVPHELHQTIMRLYGGPEVAERSILLNFISFGFKRGLPQDADMVLDVRFLPNPFYDPQLRPLNGLDEPVERFIKAYPEAQIFIDKTIELITFLIPHYIAEGKSSLTVAIGCTGGQHRSVCLCQWLCESMRSAGYTTSQIHRDMNRH